MQSKRHSWIETATNTSIGFVGSWLITWFVFHTMTTAWAVTVTTIGCTIWSLIRGYLVRRYFNAKAHRDPGSGV